MDEIEPEYEKHLKENHPKWYAEYQLGRKHDIKWRDDLIRKLQGKDVVAKLVHHKDTTVGLWATDKPEAIPDDIKDLFWELTF